MPRNWLDLPSEVRREVETLAESGQHHPNADVARTAFEWAQQVTRGSKRTVNVGLVAEAIVDGLTGAYGAGQTLAQRRLARRIVELGAP